MDTEIAPWTLEKQIGSDAAFRKYQAYHKKTGYRAMLKLANQVVLDREKREAILDRVKTIVEFAGKEPHIARYIDWGFDEDRLFVVIEPVKGITLREKYRGQQGVPPSTMLLYLKQLREVLKHAHNYGIFPGLVFPSSR